MNPQPQCDEAALGLLGWKEARVENLNSSKWDTGSEWRTASSPRDGDGQASSQRAVGRPHVCLILTPLLGSEFLKVSFSSTEVLIWRSPVLFPLLDALVLILLSYLKEKLI